MKSNGFGRFKQQIVLRVEQDYAPQVEECLNTAPFRILPSGHRDFMWERLSSNLRNDEDVVIDAYMMVDMEKCSIVWDESEY
jgi:hypothetical protein